MPRIVFKSLFGGFLLLAMSCRIALADSFYCELTFDDSVPPVSLKLDIFTDGSASAVLDDQSFWIQTEKHIRLQRAEDNSPKNPAPLGMGKLLQW